MFIVLKLTNLMKLLDCGAFMCPYGALFHILNYSGMECMNFRSIVTPVFLGSVLTFSKLLLHLELVESVYQVQTLKGKFKHK
jgi:hypothetical protein